MVVGKTQWQRCPRQTPSAGAAKTWLAKHRRLGMPDRTLKGIGTHQPKAGEITDRRLRRSCLAHRASAGRRQFLAFTLQILHLFRDQGAKLAISLFLRRCVADATPWKEIRAVAYIQLVGFFPSDKFQALICAFITGLFEGARPRLPCSTLHRRFNLLHWPRACWRQRQSLRFRRGHGVLHGITKTLECLNWRCPMAHAARRKKVRTIPNIKAVFLTPANEHQITILCFHAWTSLNALRTCFSW